MIEMLGVLALVAVLTVGGIAGYSKAMKMHKLNIQAQEMNYLITMLIEYRSKIKTTITNEILASLDLLPEHIKRPPVGYDIMNNFVGIQKIYHEGCALTSTGCDYITINVTLYPDSDLDDCRNLMKVAKSRHEDLLEFNFLRPNSSTPTDYFYGSSYCGVVANISYYWYKPCLRELTVERIEEICHHCDGSKCTLRFIIPGK